MLTLDNLKALLHLSPAASIKLYNDRPMSNDNLNAILTLDTSGTFLTANKILLGLADCTFEELTALSFIPFVDTEDLEKVKDKFSPVCNEEVVSYEARVMSVNRHLRVLQIKSMPIFIDNKVMEIYVVARDITEKKNVVKELDNQKRKYKDLFNLNPSPQFIYNVETSRFHEVNDAAVSAYGYSRNEFLQMNISDIRLQAGVELLRDILVTVQKGKLDTTARHLTKSGEIIHVLVEGNSVSYEEQNARIVVVLDQTEKLKVRKAIELSEQRFRSLVQEGSDIIDVVDQQGNYLYIGANSKANLGHGLDYFIGRNAFEHVHEEDKGLVKEATK